jgi:hypothetical protein
MMDPKKMGKQMIDFYKATFDNSFSAMLMLQEQTERMIHLSLEQATMLPKEGKKVYTEWLKACTKGSETFKKAVDDGFEKMAGFLA